MQSTAFAKMDSFLELLFHLTVNQLRNVIRIVLNVKMMELVLIVMMIHKKPITDNVFVISVFSKTPTENAKKNQNVVKMKKTKITNVFVMTIHIEIIMENV